MTTKMTEEVNHSMWKGIITILWSVNNRGIKRIGVLSIQRIHWGDKSKETQVV